MIPAFPQFIDFGSVSYADYQHCIKDFEAYSDFNYVSIFAWSPPGTCRLSLLNGNLVLAIKDYLSGETVLTVLGRNDLVATAVTLLEFAETNDNFKKSLELVPAVVAEEIRATINDLIVEEDHDNHDYILSASQYATLPGKTFENKRKNINKFNRLYGHMTEIRLTDLKDAKQRDNILELSKRWGDWGTDGSVNAKDELVAITKLMDNVQQLLYFSNLHCIELVIDGKLEGFCVFEILDNEYAVTHFGKANIQIDKAYEYMMVQTLRHVNHEFNIDFVNNEQDLGISGLRHSKLAQHPIKFLKKYSISLNPAPQPSEFSNAPELSLIPA